MKHSRVLWGWLLGALAGSMSLVNCSGKSTRSDDSSNGGKGNAGGQGGMAQGGTAQGGTAQGGTAQGGTLAGEGPDPTGGESTGGKGGTAQGGSSAGMPPACDPNEGCSMTGTYALVVDVPVRWDENGVVSSGSGTAQIVSGPTSKTRTERSRAAWSSVLPSPDLQSCDA